MVFSTSPTLSSNQSDATETESVLCLLLATKDVVDVTEISSNW